MTDALRTVALAALVVASVLVPVVAAAPAGAMATAGAADPTGVAPADLGATGEPGITVDHEGDAVTVANGSQQVISGTADVPVGTELLVRVQSTGDTQPRFIKSTNAVVREDGTWAVTFDFSRQHAGGTFELAVGTENGSMSTTVDGEIVACGGDCADPTPEPTPTPRPEQPGTATDTPGDSQADVLLHTQAVSVERGGVAAIEVIFHGTDAVVVTVGNESESGYELVTVVRDEDEDGRAVLYVDTALAGRQGRTVSASGGDSVSVRAESELGSQLDAGSYDIGVHAGTDAEGEPTTLGTLIVQRADDTPAQGEPATATPTDRPATSGGLDRTTLGILASGAFLLGGAGLAVVLLRN